MRLNMVIGYVPTLLRLFGSRRCQILSDLKSFGDTKKRLFTAFRQRNSTGFGVRVFLPAAGTYRRINGFYFAMQFLILTFRLPKTAGYNEAVY